MSKKETPQTPNEATKAPVADAPVEEKAEKAQDNTISVKSKKSGNEIEFEKNFGSSLKEAVELFGEEIVLTNFKAQATIKIQAAVRTTLDKGGTLAEAAKLAEEWKPGVVRRSGAPKQNPVQAVLAGVASGKIDATELRELLAKLEAQQAAE
ncbi:hypothetical protein HN911_13395 [Candidatus Bathyarchaeota archaeon]|nr:hypothetical protein [Candidatus Bathyarchaeota archaeon]